MRRGELYLVRNPGSQDPKKQRVFASVSRQFVVNSKLSTVICAPVYSRYDGLSTQVKVGIEEGLKHESSIHCDELVSIAKAWFTGFVGQLSHQKTAELDRALAIALDLNLEASPDH